MIRLVVVAFLRKSHFSNVSPPNIRRFFMIYIHRKSSNFVITMIHVLNYYVFSVNEYWKSFACNVFYICFIQSHVIPCRSMSLWRTKHGKNIFIKMTHSQSRKWKLLNVKNCQNYAKANKNQRKHHNINNYP